MASETVFYGSKNLVGIGNVGIGTTNPISKLDVYGTDTTNTYLNSQAIGNSGGSLYLYSNSSNGTGFFVSGVGKAYINGSAMSPWTDNNITLGSSGGRYVSVFAVNGTIQTSDLRYKDSIPLEYGLNEVLQANTILYSWKTQADLPDTDPTKNYKYFGICADQLATIMPELCYTEDSNVAIQINYSELIPVIINSIKELSTKNINLEETVNSHATNISSLETRLQTAKKDIDLLETRLAAIEALLTRV